MRATMDEPALLRNVAPPLHPGPPMLPVEAILDDLSAALERTNTAVLSAPPGAGKTTLAPLALLGAPWRGDRRIIMLSPRRITARAGAARIASLLGEEVGRTVGYRVRLESRVSAATRIEVVTEGVFKRMILDDPALAGVGAVIFDEFHERSLDGDLGLALARDAQQGLREDLRLLVMSATLDTEALSTLLGGAPVIRSEGRRHDVAIRYRTADARSRLDEAVARAVVSAMAQDQGSALVFLPGAAEIERAGARLRESLPDIAVHALYGALDARDQDAAIAPAPRGARKIVLATSIAESSLTIDGVRIVIDSGWTRRPRYEPGLGLAHLETVRASQAAIAQRAGRAGRTEPGVCVRLWEEGETRALPAFDRPEMLDADLSGLALDLAAWRVADPSVLSWLDPPPPVAWEEAQATLRALGALDAQGRITDHGARLQRLPLPPRLAHMLASAGDDGALAARLAVLLTEQGLGGRDADLRDRLQRWGEDRSPRAHAARRLAERFQNTWGAQPAAIDAERSGLALARAFPDRVAKARGARAEFLMANGRAAGVDEADPLAREPFLVIAEATGRADRTRVLAAAPIAREDIERLFPDRIVAQDSVTLDLGSGTVRARRTRRLGRITLADAPLAEVSDAALSDALIAAVREMGAGALPWPESAQALRARVAFLRALDGDAAWPDWSDAALTATVADWAPAHGVRRMSDLEPRLFSALSDVLSHTQRTRLAKEAPERFETPAGSALRIDYACEGAPALDVRLQEMFGMSTHPAVASGRAPLLLRLLSPAGRPVQTTRDLPGFWRGSYASVRADMRGRYPKHPWPEDPLAAAPTRRAKPRTDA
jgi:ATP-dependent helicase HrpB